MRSMTGQWTAIKLTDVADANWQVGMPLFPKEPRFPDYLNGLRGTKKGEMVEDESIIWMSPS